MTRDERDEIIGDLLRTISAASELALVIRSGVGGDLDIEADRIVTYATRARDRVRAALGMKP